MRKPTRSREVGRGEKVVPRAWRLRLPLPWPGVPHCNAWALAAGPGILLVDTLGRVSLYFDTGYTPDPVAEFLDSLDKVERVDARLVLSGHGRPFTDVAGHVAANRALVEQRLSTVQAALTTPRTAYEIAQDVYGERFVDATAGWLLSKTLAWLAHLERRGLAQRAGEAPECWSAAA